MSEQTNSEPNTEVVEVSKAVPALTAEHQNQILRIQRQILNSHVMMANLKQQVETSTQSLNSLINKIAKELEVDIEKYSFDLDNLAIVPKE